MNAEVGARPAGLREPLVTYAVVTALASGLFAAGGSVPWIAENLHGAIAFLFLTAPAAAAFFSRRPFDYGDAGLRLDPIGPGLRVLGGAIAIAWPLFFVGFLLYYGTVCGAAGSSLFGGFVDWLTPQCPRYLGWAGAHFRWGDPGDGLGTFLLTVATQLLVVAVPEELFFRGYLQRRFDERWPPRRQLWGAALGRGWWLSAALFALGHVLVDFNPERFAVFVPGLVFGWMRARTGSLAAGATFHALCNVYSDLLHRSFFR
ncbi:MAG TPA: CPBP family intramembrane glutamic endopeptidase [Polyangia bacterium]